MATITALDVLDIRFPTSRSLDGSDAMNPDPDYSAAYVIVRTDAGDGLEGHGLTFTIGRGTEICVVAAQAFEPFVVGRTLEGISHDAPPDISKPHVRRDVDGGPRDFERIEIAAPISPSSSIVDRGRTPRAGRAPRR